MLVLDEPGNDLDVDMLAQVEDLLDGWPGTLILVTHDPEVVPYCHRLIKIRDGAIIADEAVKS